MADHKSDKEYVAAWNTGRDEARALAKELGMKPAGNATWWDTPWKDEDKHVTQEAQKRTEYKQ